MNLGGGADTLPAPPAAIPGVSRPPPPRHPAGPGRPPMPADKHQTAAGLAELHAAHRELARVRDALEKGPRQVRARRKAVATKEAEVAQLREKLTTLKKLGDEKNLQLRSNEEKIVGLRAKLNQADSNDVFNALKGQIAADTAANSVLEDAILETLDRVDAGAAAVKEAEADRDKRSADAETFEREVDQRKAGLEAERAALEARLAEAEKIVPATLKADYGRLVQAHGATALAEIEDRVCTACSTTISPQQKVQLNMGEFVFCRNCGRLLYRGG